MKTAVSHTFGSCAKTASARYKLLHDEPINWPFLEEIQEFSQSIHAGSAGCGNLCQVKTQNAREEYRLPVKFTRFGLVRELRDA